MKYTILKKYFYGGTEFLEEKECETIEELQMHCAIKYDIAYWRNHIGFREDNYPRIVVEELR